MPLVYHLINDCHLFHAEFSSFARFGLRSVYHSRSFSVQIVAQTIDENAQLAPRPSVSINRAGKYTGMLRQPFLYKRMTPHNGKRDILFCERPVCVEVQ